MQSLAQNSSASQASLSAIQSGSAGLSSSATATSSTTSGVSGAGRAGKQTEMVGANLNAISNGASSSASAEKVFNGTSNAGNKIGSNPSQSDHSKLTAQVPASLSATKDQALDVTKAKSANEKLSSMVPNALATPSNQTQATNQRAASKTNTGLGSIDQMMPVDLQFLSAESLRSMSQMPDHGTSQTNSNRSSGRQTDAAQARENVQANELTSSAANAQTGSDVRSAVLTQFLGQNVGSGSRNGGVQSNFEVNSKMDLESISGDGQSELASSVVPFGGPFGDRSNVSTVTRNGQAVNSQLNADQGQRSKVASTEDFLSQRQLLNAQPNSSQNVNSQVMSGLSSGGSNLSTGNATSNGPGKVQNGNSANRMQSGADSKRNGFEVDLSQVRTESTKIKNGDADRLDSILASRESSRHDSSSQAAQAQLQSVMQSHTGANAGPNEVTGQVVSGINGTNRLSSTSIESMAALMTKFQSQGQMSGPQEMKVRLRPDHMGEMTIKISTHGDRVSLKVAADSAESKKVIEDSLKYLEENLQSKNMTLGRVEVDVMSTDMKTAMNQGDSSRSQSNSGGSDQFSQQQSMFANSNGQGQSSQFDSFDRANQQANQMGDAEIREIRSKTAARRPGLATGNWASQGNSDSKSRVDIRV